jgi:hypothetical protein
MADISDFHMALADGEADRDALLNQITKELRDGTATPRQQQFIAKLLDPNATTFFIFTLTQRGKVNPDDYRQGRETFLRLYKIWQDVDNKRNFVRIAISKTGLSKNTIYEYRRSIMEVDAYQRQIDLEMLESLVEDGLISPPKTEQG